MRARWYCQTPITKAIKNRLLAARHAQTADADANFRAGQWIAKPVPDGLTASASPGAGLGFVGLVGASDVHRGQPDLKRNERVGAGVNAPNNPQRIARQKQPEAEMALAICFRRHAP